jgi:predicted AAA+ superfamily ATPase
MNGIRPRWFVQNLESALRVLPVTVVTGARQTGKTTLVNSLGPARTYLTLDDLGVLDQAERHPDQLLSSRPVTLDEVQRTPLLLLAVKRAVDERAISCSPARPISCSWAGWQTR